MEEKTGKLPNYRKVQSCPNCEHCEDEGVDEEVLMCHLLGDSHYDEIYIDHDGTCDLYKKMEG